MQRAHQDNADYRLECSQGKVFGARQKISGRVVHEHIERRCGPDASDHRFNGCCVAHVAGMGVDLLLVSAACTLVQFLLGRGENFLPASADVDFRAQFQEALGRGFAETGAAAGDQDAFALEQVFLEHWSSADRTTIVTGKIWSGLPSWRPGGAP